MPEGTVETGGILDWLERAGQRPDGGLRFVDRAERATWFGWGEVRERALAVAGGLQALGIERGDRGDRVALVFPTGIDFFAGFFGALLAGAVPVPLYPPARLGRMEEYLRRTARMLERSGARLVLADSRLRRILGEAEARPGLGCRTVDDLPRGPARPVRTKASDLALIQFSSGTTVDPKPVALSHRALAAQTAILTGFFPDSPERRQSCVSWLPLYHDMGLIGCVFPALARDAALTLLGPELFVARPSLWLRTIASYRATISPAPNFAYELCLTRVPDADLEGVDLSGWRTALNGAESISPAVLRAFCARFARWGFRPEAMTPVYGLSEAALAVTFSDFDRPPRVARFDRDKLARESRAREAAEGREIVSVGRPVPGFRLRIVDPDLRDLRDLPAGAVGRVWIQGPSLMDGYLGDPEATASVLRDGWLDTGDLGFLYGCEGGELYLTGRARDVVILRGRNYAPEEIERAVEGVPGVRAGCAAAASWLPEDAPGEMLSLFVEASRQATAEELAALPDACREAVLGATGLAVDHLVVLAPGALPRTSSGKLRRGETLRLYLAGELAVPDPAPAPRLTGALA
ncbi:MAG TPA: fatty acyl-AMP ligase [Thermoanaerobaculia bacterium]|nr:fatty acyl-AMP ligase [Thermoanaerobaculia bacterium]